MSVVLVFVSQALGRATSRWASLVYLKPYLDSPIQPFVMGDSDNRELSASTGRSFPWNGPAHHPDLTDVLACTEMVCLASPSAGCKRGFCQCLSFGLSWAIF